MRSFPVQKNKSVLNSIPLVTNETARKLIKKVNIKVLSFFCGFWLAILEASDSLFDSLGKHVGQFLIHFGVISHDKCYRMKINKSTKPWSGWTELNSEKWGDKNSSAMNSYRTKSVWFSSFMAENDVKCLNQSNRLTSFSDLVVSLLEFLSP